MKIIGVDKVGMSSAHPPGRVDFLVVLTEGRIGDVKAYRGVGPIEWVASHGDKLSLAGASAHFPNLEAILRASSRTYDGQPWPKKGGDDAS